MKNIFSILINKLCICLNLSCSDHEISLSSIAPIIVFNINTAKSKVNNTSNDTVMAKNTKSDIEK